MCVMVVMVTVVMVVVMVVAVYGDGDYRRSAFECASRAPASHGCAMT